MKNGVYTVKLLGRTCEDCQVTFREGYMTKLVHPEDGEWDIGEEHTAWVGMELVRIDPEKSSIFKAADEAAARLRAQHPLPQPVITTRTVDPIEEATEALDYFPALNLFLIVLTLFMLMAMAAGIGGAVWWFKKKRTK